MQGGNGKEGEEGKDWINSPHPKANGAVIKNPYPSERIQIDCASYEGDLCLGRKKTALQSTNSEASYVVTRDYKVTYRIKGKKGSNSIIVPDGMLTDLASVPRWARSFYGRVGKHLEAAIVHDWLYMAWQLFHPYKEDHNEKPPCHYRYFADDLFYRLLRASGGFSLCDAAVLTCAVQKRGEKAFRERNDGFIIVEDEKDVLAC